MLLPRACCLATVDDPGTHLPAALAVGARWTLGALRHVHNPIQQMAPSPRAASTCVTLQSSTPCFGPVDAAYDMQENPCETANHLLLHADRGGWVAAHLRVCDAGLGLH